MKITTRFLLYLALLSVLSAAAVQHPHAPAADGGSFPTSTPTKTPEPPVHPTPTGTQLSTAIPTATETQPSIESPADSSVRQDSTAPTSAPPQVPDNPSAASQLMPVIYIGFFGVLAAIVAFMFYRRNKNP